MKSFFEKLQITRAYANFWVPGILIFLFSCLHLYLDFCLKSDALHYPIAGIFTGLLLIFRTRLGTALYFWLIFFGVTERMQKGFDLSSHTVVIGLIIKLWIFYGLLGIGWEQIVYHFQRHQTKQHA